MDPDFDRAPTRENPLELVHQGWRHLRLQRPLAAWAAWQQALRLRPDDRAATEALAHLAASPVLPGSARTVLRLRPPEDESRRERWNQAFQGRDLGELQLAAEHFEGLAAEDANDASAHYNHALCLAWMGENVEAIAALDQFVRLTAGSDLDAAADAWMTVEVLRHGAGAEAIADDLNATARIAWPVDRGTPETLDEPGRIGLHPVSVDPATGAPADPDTAAYEWLDRPMPKATEVASFEDLPRILANVIRRPGYLEFSTPRLEGCLAIEDRLRAIADDLPGRLDWTFTPLPLRFLDAALWTFRLPPGLDPQRRHALSRDAVEHFYENEWILTPRHGLAASSVLDRSSEALSPLHAARRAADGDATLRAKLEGLVRFREQLAARPGMAEMSAGYPFDRLRRRLGLDVQDESHLDRNDYSCASADELEAVEPESMNTVELAVAERSARAVRLDRVAERMARVLASRHPDGSTGPLDSRSGPKPT